MEGNMFKKSLVVGIIILFIGMSIVPSVNAFSMVKSNNQYEKEIKDVESKEDLPDLIIVDIYDKPGWNPYVTEWVYLLKNIGNGPCPEWEWIPINIELTIEKIRDGKVYKTEHYNFHKKFLKSPPLQPGESEDAIIFSDEYISDYGRLYFSSVVNPDHTIQESNYNNNYYEKVVMNSVQRVEDCDVSKNSLEITEEVEKSEVNEKNDYDCLPCVLKENILNKLNPPFPTLKLPFIICLYFFFLLMGYCEFASGGDPEEYKRCMEDMYEWFYDCVWWWPENGRKYG